MIITAIVAVAENGVIGREGDLPWHLPDDMKFFKDTTLGHHIITGRKNYESIPPKYRPLKDRTNIVVTRSLTYDAPGAVLAHSLHDALDVARMAGETEAFIIGGGQIFAEAIHLGLVDRIYLTTVHAAIDGDVFFPEIGPEWNEEWYQSHPADERHAHSFTFRRLERVHPSDTEE